MIVTRQRKRRSGVGRILVPLGVLAVLGFLLALPPVQRAIAHGPLAPAWKAGTNATRVVVRPFTFAAQQQSIADRNRRIRDLTAQLEREREATDDAEARADELAQQLTAALNEPPVAPLPVPHARRLSGSRTAASPADDRRLAATWAAMEPERAAAIAMHLPDDQVSRVLAQMDPDSAGAIMDVLPTKVAVRLSRAVAQVSTGVDR